MQSTKQAIFMLGEEEYGLDIMNVITIEKPIAIEPVASFSKNLKGIIKLRGDIIPVFSLRRKFGMEEIATNDDTRFIITTSNGLLIAYEVDKMTEILQINENQEIEVPEIVKSLDTSYMKSVVNNNDHLVINLDHDLILTEDEIEKIKKVVNK